jgi:hypothetical protein
VEEMIALLVVLGYLLIGALIVKLVATFTPEEVRYTDSSRADGLVVFMYTIAWPVMGIILVCEKVLPYVLLPLANWLAKPIVKRK